MAEKQHSETASTASTQNNIATEKDSAMRMLAHRVITGTPTFHSISPVWRMGDESEKALAYDVVWVDEQGMEVPAANDLQGYAVRVLMGDEGSEGDLVFGFAPIASGGKACLLTVQAPGRYVDACSGVTIRGKVSVVGRVVAQKEFESPAQLAAERAALVPETYRKPRYARGEHPGDCEAVAARIMRGVVLMLGEEDEMDLNSITNGAMSCCPGFLYLRNEFRVHEPHVLGESIDEDTRAERDEYLREFAASMFRAGELAERSDPKGYRLTEMLATSLPSRTA